MLTVPVVPSRCLSVIASAGSNQWKSKRRRLRLLVPVRGGANLAGVPEPAPRAGTRYVLYISDSKFFFSSRTILCKIGAASMLIFTAGTHNVYSHTCSARDSRTFSLISNAADFETRDVTLLTLCFIAQVLVEDAGGLSHCDSHLDRRIQRMRLGA